MGERLKSLLILVLYPLALVLTVVMLALVFAPLLLLAIICMPLAVVHRWIRAYRRGRLLALRTARQCIKDCGGTLLLERDSKSIRLWWTADDLLALSPYVPPTPEDYEQRHRQTSVERQEWKNFEWDDWCYENYTHWDQGRGMTVFALRAKRTWEKLETEFPQLTVVETRAYLTRPSNKPASNASWLSDRVGLVVCAAYVFAEIMLLAWGFLWLRSRFW